MIPIRQLLNRIRWDEDFGEGDFELGYYDRVSETILRLPLDQLEFEEGHRFDFKIVDPDGTEIHIPLHRVREVRKDGKTIWERPGD